MLWLVTIRTSHINISIVPFLFCSRFILFFGVYNLIFSSISVMLKLFCFFFFFFVCVKPILRAYLQPHGWERPMHSEHYSQVTLKFHHQEAKELHTKLPSAAQSAVWQLKCELHVLYRHLRRNTSLWESSVRFQQQQDLQAKGRAGHRCRRLPGVVWCGEKCCTAVMLNR